MIRNVVMGRLRAADTEQQASEDRERLAAALAGIAALELPGCRANHAGVDANLRDGGWDFAITNDWATADDYRGYDVDAEHAVLRAEVVAVSEQVARVQFEI